MTSPRMLDTWGKATMRVLSLSSCCRSSTEETQAGASLAFHHLTTAPVSSARRTQGPALACSDAAPTSSWVQMFASIIRGRVQRSVLAESQHRCKAKEAGRLQDACTHTQVPQGQARQCTQYAHTESGSSIFNFITELCQQSGYTKSDKTVQSIPIQQSAISTQAR